MCLLLDLLSNWLHLCAKSSTKMSKNILYFISNVIYIMSKITSKHELYVLLLHDVSHKCVFI
jgi:hypothetical protein